MTCCRCDSARHLHLPVLMGPRIIQDANEAVASIAYRLSEVIAIYPITPASPMGEWADDWATHERPNVFGSVPVVAEMQAEGGAAGAVHGALQAGALSTTFTASQGLLLMIPNLYKIAGELTPCVIHVAARSLASHALSIFCDHSDVMACRQTGFALLASDSVQQAQDFACVAHASTLRSRVPFLHFFDGFRTSHELMQVDELSDDDLRAAVDHRLIDEHRRRALSPDAPVVRGTAQNPDAFFQAREAVNPYYDACVGVVEEELAKFGERTGRHHRLFQYHGHPEAEHVVVCMGSAGQTVAQSVQALNAEGARLGVVQVALYRPFSVERFVAALPTTVKRIAVLDRTKEPGSIGDPLYLDIVAAIARGWAGEQPPLVLGGRYGLSSKEFTPQMVRAVFDALGQPTPPRTFTVGINDDVTHLSLPEARPLDPLGQGVTQALFYGLGSDGTVGANKNSIKIIGEETDLHVQGYFVYDSKKAGAVTVSHLRFGPEPIAAPYLIDEADFVACHQFDFLAQRDVLERAKPGGVFLLNSPYAADRVWKHLPAEVQQQIRSKSLTFYVMDAYRVAQQAGMGRRINTVMQTAFFAISGVLPKDVAIEKIKGAIRKSYEKKGPELVRRNLEAVDTALDHLHRVDVPTNGEAGLPRPPVVPRHAPDFVQRVTAMLLAGKGDSLPVSAFPVDGTWPTATSQWEKRNIATEIPVWDPQVCIQCNKCVLVCPHAAIRAKVYDQTATAGAPDGFKWVNWKSPPFKGQAYTIAVAPEDCTGCRLCAQVCPAKDKGNPRHKALDMADQRPLREAEGERFDFFLKLPEVDPKRVPLDVKGTQLLRPLIEYSGACPGCGETPYIKLLTQLFGDRALIANATGCSSIYGGNLPTTPYATNADGRGPAWSNSLFEDNAEFGFGMRLALDAQRAAAVELLRPLTSSIGDELVDALLSSPQTTASEIDAQRQRVTILREKLAALENNQDAGRLMTLAEHFVNKSVWLVGGDGWAYDIGYGGLDHVLASHRNINVLVLDTEVYSNTGGQQSKATPLGAAAKFAMAGKGVPKKDLGLLAMSYGHVYVARVAFGAKDAQTVRAFVEAEAHPGPSLIIAYSHCIAHGYDLSMGADQQRLAVQSGAWPLFRFDPRRAAAGDPPLLLDSGHPNKKLREYMLNETRFRMVEKLDPKRFAHLLDAAQRYADQHTSVYEQLAHLIVPPGTAPSLRPDAQDDPAGDDKKPDSKPAAPVAKEAN